MTSSPPAALTRLIDDLRTRALVSGQRQIVGIIGAPGAGKSTAAEMIAQLIGCDSCAVVPMDGFHLANEVLHARGSHDRKGAIDTFDVGGYLALLDRLRRRDEPVVWAPTYRRGLEEAIAGAIPVARHLDFVITEGNYLLVDEQPWGRVRDYLDSSIFIETPQEVRLERLIRRHVSFGMEKDAARLFTHGPDEVNAQLVKATRAHADVVIHFD